MENRIYTVDSYEIAEIPDLDSMKKIQTRKTNETLRTNGGIPPFVQLICSANLSPNIFTF